MITACDLSVRTGPGANYRRKIYEELTKNAKAHDYDKDGCLNYGTRVTILLNRKLYPSDDCKLYYPI